MDGLGPRLWTLWAGLKSPHARAARPDRAVGLVRVVGLGLGRTNIFFLLKIYLFILNK